MSKYKNVTFIDDLFDADALMQNTDMERDSLTNQIQNRHIRKHHNYQENPSPVQTYIPQHQLPPQLPQPVYQYSPPVYQPYDNIIDSHLSCMTIANHIKDCPICSRFYNPNVSMYIICIVLLIIACVFLLKRVLEKS